MKVRTHPNTIVMDLMWWLIEHPRWLRVAVYGSILTAPFILAALSGSSMYVATFMAAPFAVSLLFVFALRRSGLM
jgi:hypothetical protein